MKSSFDDSSSASVNHSLQSAVASIPADLTALPHVVLKHGRAMMNFLADLEARA